MRELLLIAIVLACPLMMMFMMRGGHGHGGHGSHTGERGNEGGHGHGDSSREPRSSAELRRERDDLERLIEARETEEQTPTAVGDGWR
jgi:hypothetical protein